MLTRNSSLPQITLDHPAPQSCVTPRSDDGGIDILVGMTVNEPTNIFVQRQLSSKLCFEMAWIEGELRRDNSTANPDATEQPLTFQTHVQSHNLTLSLSSSGAPGVANFKKIGCASFSESGTSIKGLRDGKYAVKIYMMKLWSGEEEEKEEKDEGQNDSYDGVKVSGARYEFYVRNRSSDCSRVSRGRCYTAEARSFPISDSAESSKSSLVEFCLPPAASTSSGKAELRASRELYEIARSYCVDKVKPVHCIDKIVEAIVGDIMEG